MINLNNKQIKCKCDNTQTTPFVIKKIENVCVVSCNEKIDVVISNLNHNLCPCKKDILDIVIPEKIKEYITTNCYDKYAISVVNTKLCNPIKPSCKF